jgi:hypothetical protein
MLIAELGLRIAELGAPLRKDWRFRWLGEAVEEVAALAAAADDEVRIRETAEEIHGCGRAAPVAATEHGDVDLCGRGRVIGTQLANLADGSESVTKGIIEGRLAGAATARACPGRTG